jgi:hypothetical protein
MASRYDARRVFTNTNDIYFHLFEERGLGSIVQYDTAIFSKLTKSDIARISTTQKIWTTGDRLYKVAADYYGDSRYWWIIARFNGRPTESHFKPGDVIYIPGPAELILGLYRR